VAKKKIVEIAKTIRLLLSEEKRKREKRAIKKARKATRKAKKKRQKR
jgi:hypothetical protein